MIDSFASVGHCIYCGALRYSSAREKLGREHVIPEALDGEIVLPEASCQSCERDINVFEQYNLRRLFGSARSLIGMRSKRPKERPKTVSMELQVEGDWVTRDVPVEYAPAGVLLPKYPRAGLLKGEAFNAQPTATSEFMHFGIAPVDFEYLRREFNADRGRFSKVDLRSDYFGRQVAKIAHGYAFAHRELFPPAEWLLPQVILGTAPDRVLPFLVGCDEELAPAAGGLIQVDLGSAQLGKRIAVIVRVRFFGQYGTPTYHAVTKVIPAL